MLAVCCNGLKVSSEVRRHPPEATQELQARLLLRARADAAVQDTAKLLPKQDMTELCLSRT